MLGMIALLCLLALAIGQEEAPGDTTLRVMTYNIRYNNPEDGQNAWPNRREQVATIIQDTGAAIVGIQEALHGQVVDLAALLPEYAWFGVGRDDGKGAGEYAPVFYRRDRLELVEAETFWLSETPDTPGSRSWDAAITRIVTSCKFRDKASGATLLLWNTHFDHRGEHARLESAKLIVRMVGAMVASQPVIVTGDFNFEPQAPPHGVLTSGGLVDARDHSTAEPVGPMGTFSGFVVRPEAPARRIDYIFVGRTVAVERYAVIDAQADGFYVSDHLPVLVTLKLARQ